MGQSNPPTDPTGHQAHPADGQADADADADSGHDSPPKLRVQLGAVLVETQGGPEDESIADIRDQHEDAVEDAIAASQELSEPGEGGFR